MMKDNSNSNNYPDLSGLFQIDDKDIPDKIIKKDPEQKTVKEPILISQEAVNSLPKPARKAITKEKRQKMRDEAIAKAKKRIIITGASLVALVVAISLISFFLSNAKRPEVSYEKVQKETVVAYAKNTGVTYNNGSTFEAVFIDNDYDVNFITPGQTVQMTADGDLTVTGIVKEIKEEPVGSDIITKYYNILTGTMPATSVYAVYVTPDSTESFNQAGIPLDIKVITGTSEDALTVPSAAIHSDNGQAYVWIYSSFTKSITRKNVTVGLSYDGRTEITSEIKRSAKVISAFSCSPEELAEGIKVRAKKG